jgi:hypothetical protein
LAKLWKFYDGEPFMENPHIALIGNPKKVRSNNSQKGKKMAFKQKHRRSTVRKNSPRRRKARRNFPAAGLVFNPRRRHRRSRAANPSRHRHSYAMRNPHQRRHARRNPAVLGVALPPLNMIAWGAGGFIVTPMVERFVNSFLPTSVTGSTLGRYAVKIGAALGLTYLTKMVLGNKEAFPVAMGGSLYVVVSAVNEFAPQLTGATTTATNAYRNGMINAYRGGMIPTGVPRGMGAYTTKGFNGAIPGLARSLPGLAYGAGALLPPYNINFTGMENPTYADPRFASNPQMSR